MAFLSHEIFMLCLHNIWIKCLCQFLKILKMADLSTIVLGDDDLTLPPPPLRGRDMPLDLKFPRGVEAEPYFVVNGMRVGFADGVASVLERPGSAIGDVLKSVVERLSVNGRSVLWKDGFTQDSVNEGLRRGSLNYYTQRQLLDSMDLRNADLIMTPGGDCAGISDCIAAIAASVGEDRILVGVNNAGEGLAVPPEEFLDHLTIMDPVATKNMRGRSSTPLGSIRKELMNGHRGDMMKNLSRVGNIIGTGGNGGMNLMRVISEEFPEKTVVVGAKSIDNDARMDGESIRMMGSDTAVRENRRAIYNIVQTAYSHRQVFVVQVSGRDSGFLPFESARRDPAILNEPPNGNNSVVETCNKIRDFGEAVMILVPEKPTSMDAIAAEVKRIRWKHKFCVIVVGENFKLTDAAEDINKGVRIADILAPELQERLGLSAVKPGLQGHEPRGAAPSEIDQLIGRNVGEGMGEVIKAGVPGGYAVVYLEGMDPAREKPRVLPLGIVTADNNLNRIPDHVLRRGGVFW